MMITNIKLYYIAIRILKADILRDVTSETINKVYDPNKFDQSKEDILRNEFSLVKDEDFWFYRYLRIAVPDVAEKIKSLNKGELGTYQILDNEVVFYITVAEGYDSAVIRDRAISAIVYHITASWFRMKNRMDLYNIYLLSTDQELSKLRDISSSGVEGTKNGGKGKSAGKRIYDIGFRDGFIYYPEQSNSTPIDPGDVGYATKEELNVHISNKSNPHAVTKEQVGLSNVLNEKQATKVEFDDHIKDFENLSEEVEQISENLTEHIDDNDLHFVSGEKQKLSDSVTGATQGGAGILKNGDTLVFPKQPDTPEEVGAEPAGSVEFHNQDINAHPNIQNKIPTELSQLADDDTHRLVTDAEKENWNSAKSTADEVNTRLEAVEEKIPGQATSENQLADKDFVNSSINSGSAYFLSFDSGNSNFPTKASLDSATEFYRAGAVYVPTKNDYVVVLADESQDGAQTRYINVSDTTTPSWQLQYKINDAPFTSAQNDSINSGITNTKVLGYDEHLSDNVKHITALERTNWNSKTVDVGSVVAGSGTDTTTLAQSNTNVWAMLQGIWNRIFALNTKVNAKAEDIGNISAGSGTTVSTEAYSNTYVWSMLQRIWDRIYALRVRLDGKADSATALLPAGSGTDTSTEAQSNTTVWTMIHNIWNRIFALNTKVENTTNVLTTAPTSAWVSGTRFVYLTSEPATKYDGYIYMIKES